jgi:hypothetical protein
MNWHTGRETSSTPVVCGYCDDGLCENHGRDCHWPSILGGPDLCACPNRWKDCEPRPQVADWRIR